MLLKLRFPSHLQVQILPIKQKKARNLFGREELYMLPRDHDQEPKKSYVGWEDSSSTTKDEGKNNMATQRLTEKSMMASKTGEESRPVVKQESSSNNVERGTKPKPVVVDNRTGYDLSKKESTGHVLVGGDINADDVLSKEKKKGGGRTPYSDPPKNTVDSVARTSSPLEGEKEKKAADDPPPPKTSTATTAGVQHSNPLSVPLTRTPSRRENTIETNISQTDPSFEIDKKEAHDSRTSTAKISSCEPGQSQGESPKIPSKQRDNKGILPNGMAGQYSGSPKKASEEVPFTPQSQAVNIPSTTQNGKKENGGTQYSNSSKPNVAVADGPYEADKNIAVPFAGTVVQVDKRESSHRTTQPYENEKDKKGRGLSPCCSIL